MNLREVPANVTELYTSTPIRSRAHQQNTNNGVLSLRNSITLPLQASNSNLSSMQTLRQLMQEIIHLTAEIETRYPELYSYLLETPLPVGEAREKSISTHDLKEYLETLKSQLNHHIETHGKK